MFRQFFIWTCLVASLLLGTVCAFGGEPYILIDYTRGGYDVQVDYGCGQRAAYREAASPLKIQSNCVQEALNATLTLDERTTNRANSAIDILRRTAPVIVAGNPCPQQCQPQCAPQPIRGYCGRIVGYTGGNNCQQPCAQTCTTGYCGTERPTCAAPCGTSPYWCGRTSRWCTTTGSYWCGRTSRWCSATTGDYWCSRTNRWLTATAPRGGSCCSGGGNDGRNGMVLYQPGDPRARCDCAQNPNRGGSCGCPDDCVTCNPRRIVGYGN